MVPAIGIVVANLNVFEIKDTSHLILPIPDIINYHPILILIPII